MRLDNRKPSILSYAAYGTSLKLVTATRNASEIEINSLFGTENSSSGVERTICAFTRIRNI
jgi:hypothetical protein